MSLSKRVLAFLIYISTSPSKFIKAIRIFISYGPKGIKRKLKRAEKNKFYVQYNPFVIISKKIISFIAAFLKKVSKALKILLLNGPKALISQIKSRVQSKKQVASLNDQYRIWLERNSMSQLHIMKQKIVQHGFSYRPKISIITPVYNTDGRWLVSCIDSVIKQTYDNWELCLADDASTNPEVKKILNKYSKKDKRIKVIYRKQNGHISKASNSALDMATGEFIGLLDHDDELFPHSLYSVVKLLNENNNIDFIYSDEDKLELDGKHVDPFFKPDWSPNMFLSVNYLCHFSVIRKKIVDQLGGFRVGFEGSQDYDLFLRVTEKTDRISHISDILYSWRKVPGSTAAVYEEKNYANQASINALKEALQRRKIAGSVTDGIVGGTFRVKYKIVKNFSVSIIIPTKDKSDYLKRCIKSILKKTTYKNYEIVIVDTGSVEKSTESFYKTLKKYRNIKIIRWKGSKFNYASVNNFAVKNIKNDFVLLLNNDTEIITPDWIESMLEHAQKSSVGAVGAKLLYPNNTIQHSGIILGIGSPPGRGVAGHNQKMFSDSPSGIASWNLKDMIRDYSAVTAACLLISRKKYLQVGGLKPKFRIAFNDVDFCLELLKKGYYNVYTPYAKLYHHESISVGRPEQGNRDLKEFNKEIRMMINKWRKILYNDPFYNKNLTLEHENLSLRI